MANLITGLITIAVGCALIIFRKPFVEISVGFQIFAFRMPFGKRTIQLGYFLIPLFGLVVVLAGVFILLGLFKVRV